MTLTIVLVVSALIAVIDQLIKYFVLQYLAPVGSVTVADNLLYFTYVENRGAAFGIFQDQVWLFSVLTFIMIAVFIFFIAAKKIEGKLFLMSAMLIIGGGIGNLIDRIFRGFVVDYISVSFFPPVCNFADYCITVGAVLFVISLFFADKVRKPSLDSSMSAEGDDSE